MAKDSRPGPARRGATRRKVERPAPAVRRLDRWLNVAVTIAVVTALIVGTAAVLAHWLL